MRRDPGDIPTGLGHVDLVNALSLARDLPEEALDLAADRPDRVAEAVLAVAARAARGETLAERDRNLLFWGLLVLGHARDLRLCRPLVALLRRPGDELYELFDDAFAMEALPRILIGVFDGDAEALSGLLSDPAADEGIRMAAFGAFAALAQDGRIARDAAEAFLIRFDEDRRIRAGDVGWHGWELAVGLLGLRGLLPRVAAAHAEGRLLGVMAGPEWCAERVAEAEAAPDDPARFEAQNLVPMGHPLEEADRLLGGDGEEAPEPGEPVRNPLREVGRNDPCPCGSGRKFKKCCLAA